MQRGKSGAECPPRATTGRDARPWESSNLRSAHEVLTSSEDVNELCLGGADRSAEPKNGVASASRSAGSALSRRAESSMSTQREQNDWLNLSQRMAVVTRAGSGIGAAIANVFAKAGAKVAVVDRDSEAAANVAARLAAAGGTAIAFTCDVTAQVDAGCSRWPREPSKRHQATLQQKRLNYQRLAKSVLNQRIPRFGEQWPAGARCITHPSDSDFGADRSSCEA
jgi:hypothetical protein